MLPGEKEGKGDVVGEREREEKVKVQGNVMEPSVGWGKILGGQLMGSAV